MQQAKKFYLLPFSFFLLGVLFGCGRLTRYGINDINLTGGSVTDIHDLRPQQQETTVYLKGKVIQVVPLLKQRAYQLQDSTGTIWVLTNQTALQPGDQVLIKGSVRYQSILQAGKDLGEAYVEEQHLERVPSQ